MIEKRKRKESFGGVMVETVILLPLLVFAGYVGFELSRSWQVSLIVTSISREAAREGYRQCRAAPNPADCINTLVYPRVSQFTQEALPGAEVVITMVERRINPFNGEPFIQRVSRTGMVEVPPGVETRPATPGGKFSRYENLAYLQDVVLPPGEQHTLVGEKNVMVLSEVYFTRNAYLPLVFTLGYDNTDFYETALY